MREMKGFLYLSGYNAICERLHMDAACGRLTIGNAGACGNSLAKASRDARADVDQFLLAARQYLSTADARSCKVACHDGSYQEWDLGFRTKRCGNFLYVTEARQETRLRPGMKIVAVGKNKIDFLLKDAGAEIFWGRDSDREDWDLAMRMFDDIDVFPGDGHVMRLDLRKYPVETPAPEFGVRTEGNAVIARVDALDDADKVSKVADAVRAALAETGARGADTGEAETACENGADTGEGAGARKLVLDLRRCTGDDADPAAYLELLPFLVDAETAARDVMGDVELLSVYSKDNAQVLEDDIARVRPHLDEDGVRMADELVADIQAKADEVLARKRTTHVMAERLKLAELPETLPSPFDDERVAPDPLVPATVCILVDSTCGYAAERLAESVMGMDRVRLVGRATQGLVDYANYLTIELEGIDCTFTYPMSRTKANHDGAGYAHTGLPLDVHVPFTPEECTTDAILAAALAL